MLRTIGLKIIATLGLMLLIFCPGSTQPDSLPEEFVVINTQDTGQGSLRWAIMQANQDPGPNAINFAIPITDPGYDQAKVTFRIQVVSSLPVIADDSLIIDGRTQLSVLDGTPDLHQPTVEINGSNLSGFEFGLEIRAREVQIFDLIVVGFPGHAISLYNCEAVLIAGCFVGIEADGSTALANGLGIHLTGGSHHNAISGLDIRPNLISGNTGPGIFMQDTVHSNIIENNLIGISRDCTSIIGNMVAGIALQEASDSNAFVANIIGGNPRGIQITGGSYNEIVANHIGTMPEFQKDLGNTETGISIGGYCQGNRIIDNDIGYNDGQGVRIASEDALFNTISGNRISFNSGKGIELSSGANNDLAAPIIQRLDQNTLFGQAGPMQSIEIFLDSSDQGRYLHAATQSDGNGQWQVDLEPSEEFALTATATDSLGNTSEFSAPYRLTTALAAEQGRLPKFLAIPNPSYGSVRFDYEITEPSHVSLRIIGPDGQVITQIKSSWEPAGSYSDLWEESKLIPGIYYAKLQTQQWEQVLHLLILP